MALTKNMIYRLYFRTHTTPLHPAGNSLDATGGSITSWSKNSVHERRFITHGWPVWVVSTGGVCWVGLQITSGNDCLTFPQQSWKQSISSGYCSNDRDVCTPSGRVVRSLERCHSDSHTHTQTGKKKKKKKMHLACPTQSKISYMQTLWWWQSMELLLLLPLLQSWYSLLIPPKGLTSTSIFCIFWPGLTLTQYLNNTG